MKKSQHSFRPAFIPWNWHMKPDEKMITSKIILRAHGVPKKGYVWQAATVGTMAGWVRRRYVTLSRIYSEKYQ